MPGAPYQKNCGVVAEEEHQTSEFPKFPRKIRRDVPPRVTRTRAKKTTLEVYPPCILQEP